MRLPSSSQCFPLQPHYNSCGRYGRMTFEQFWTQVVHPLITTNPVGNKPIIDWWKAATTLNGANHNMSIATPQTAVSDLMFWGWAR